MNLDNILILRIQAEFGDAAFTFYKIEFSDEDNGNNSLMYHNHFYYECHLMLEGETGFLIESRNVSAKSGTLVIIPPYTGHHPFIPASGAKELVLCMTLEQRGQGSGEYAYFSRTLDDMCGKPLTVSDRLREMMVGFYNGFRDDGIRNECFRKAAAYGIVVNLFDEMNKFDVKSGIEEKQQTCENRQIALEVMIDDMRFSLGDIAESLGYSKRHTSRLILQRYGASLENIRQRNMVKTAEKLLSGAPSLNMGMIAVQSGFSGTDAMTRAFRKWRSVTPAEYRNGTVNK